jgi:lipopolysaccharide/colanic/teichoic acid biosynthesis glycosyltransferase
VVPPIRGGWRTAAKRTFDIVVAGGAMILTAPLLLFIAIAIKVDSSGPVFFRQRRVGRDGEQFAILKLRTMVRNAEELKADLLSRNEAAGPLFKLRNDPRITGVGRFLRSSSLDELPQLWNVIRGDMSLVGPRPTVASQVERYDARQRRRLLARPGLTGLAQVSGRNAIPWSERIEIDIAYVDRWSPRRDLAILARTARVVLARGGTYVGERGGFDLSRPGGPDG